MPTPSPSSRAPLDAAACDPARIIPGALALDCPQALRAAFLAWLLRLPDGIDAADAAAILLRVHGPALEAMKEPVLRGLLKDTTLWPRERLEAQPRAERPAALH